VASPIPRHHFEPDESNDCKRCPLPRRNKVHGDLSSQPMLLDEDALRRIIREEIESWWDARPIEPND
jgi:hypothetical protein